ncbi:MAG: hypothetical protein ABI091_12735 [Ferruginibacter sp.]
MKLPFESFATGNKFTYFFCSGGLLIIAIAFCCLHLYRPKITSNLDLIFFNGKLTEHHYYNPQSSKGGAKSCWFQIKGCSNSFFIDGNNLKVFDITGFENLSDGDSVNIGVSKRDFSRVKSETGEIFIYFLTNNNHTFLDCKDSISNYNSNHIYYICAILFIVSLILIYLGLISKVKSWI